MERRLAETALMCICEPITIYRVVEAHDRIHGAMGTKRRLSDALRVLINPIDHGGGREISETVVADSKLTSKQSTSVPGGFACSSHVLQPSELINVAKRLDLNRHPAVIHRQCSTYWTAGIKPALRSVTALPSVSKTSAYLLSLDVTVR